MTGCDCATIQAMLNNLTDRLSKIESTRLIKTKRKPSSYNLFMKDCISKLKGSKPIQQLFKECAYRFKKQKNEKVHQD